MFIMNLKRQNNYIDKSYAVIIHFVSYSPIFRASVQVIKLSQPYIGIMEKLVPHIS